MKLIIQIPCYNEEQTLPVTLKELPNQIEGIDKVMIIDDGSTDRTIEVAKENGIDHILRLPSHQGLAKGFYAGLQQCLRLGADIIVNTDADNQYKASYIKDLVKPILDEKADIVVGIRHFKYMPKFKIFLEKLGSFIVSKMTGVDIKDSVSGFRAYNRNAAMSLFIYTDFTYTLETIVQSVRKNLAIKCVPVEINKVKRKSKLVSSVFKYMEVAFLTFLNVLFLYQPLRFFIWGGSILTVAALLLGIRFLYFYFTTGGTGHIQSLILMAVLAILGFLIYMLGIIAHLIATNRRLLEENMRKIKDMMKILYQKQ